MDHSPDGVGLVAVCAVSGSVALLAFQAYKRLLSDFMKRMERELGGTYSLLSYIYESPHIPGYRCFPHWTYVPAQDRENPGAGGRGSASRPSQPRVRRRSTTLPAKVSATVDRGRRRCPWTGKSFTEGYSNIRTLGCITTHPIRSRVIHFFHAPSLKSFNF